MAKPNVQPGRAQTRLQNSRVTGVSVHYRNKFRRDRLNCCWGLAICLQNTGHSPSLICYRLRVFGPPTKSICCHGAKFAWIRCSSFDNTQDPNICALGLNWNAYSRPRNWGFGDISPQNGRHDQRDPKTALPCAEAHRISRV